MEIDTAKRCKHCLPCLILILLLLLSGLGLATEAELTNLIVRNTQEDLLIDLEVKGVFKKDLQQAATSGIPVSFEFLIILYRVHDFWLDEKIAGITAHHGIEYDAVKKEYHISRSWENSDPRVFKEFGRAAQTMSQITGLKVIPLKQLKKGRRYQIRVKSELDDKKFLFSGFPWEFETDWYSINFIY